MGSDESHFNCEGQTTVTTGQRPCPQTGHNKRKEAARPNRLSKETMNSSKKYGAASHNFHSCANKEATDHYSQSRCANKNPRATIRTAALTKNPLLVKRKKLDIVPAPLLTCLLRLGDSFSLCNYITYFRVTEILFPFIL